MSARFRCADFRTRKTTVWCFVFSFCRHKKALAFADYMLEDSNRRSLQFQYGMVRQLARLTWNLICTAEMNAYLSDYMEYFRFRTGKPAFPCKWDSRFCWSFWSWPKVMFDINLEIRSEDCFDEYFHPNFLFARRNLCHVFNKTRLKHDNSLDTYYTMSRNVFLGIKVAQRLHPSQSHSTSAEIDDDTTIDEKSKILCCTEGNSSEDSRQNNHQSTFTFYLLCIVWSTSTISARTMSRDVFLKTPARMPR